VTGGRSVLRIEGFKHSNLKTGAPNEREAHQPAAPTHARRHEHAQVRARYATRVYPCRQEARDLPRPFSRHRDGGRAVRVPAASDRDQYATTERQRDRDRAPVLLQGDTRPAGDDTTSRVRLRAAQAAARAPARGGVAPAGGRTRAEAQGGAQRCLRRWPARHGGRRTEGLRY
jgi:hypothetical protein